MLKLFLDTITKKYFKSNVRASRKEYFSFILFSTLLSEVAGFIFIINDQKMNWFIGLLIFISILFTLYSFIPSITLTIRRLHDLNLSGYWSFMIIPILCCLTIDKYKNIPLIGGVILIFFILSLIFKKGTPKANKYGEPPIN